MEISSSEYECTKKWFGIFDELALHIAEGVNRDGYTEEAVDNTLSMRDDLKNIIEAYEEGFIRES